MGKSKKQTDFHQKDLLDPPLIASVLLRIDSKFAILSFLVYSCFFFSLLLHTPSWPNYRTKFTICPLVILDLSRYIYK